MTVWKSFVHLYYRRTYSKQYFEIVRKNSALNENQSKQTGNTLLEYFVVTINVVKHDDLQEGCPSW